MLLLVPLVSRVLLPLSSPNRMSLTLYETAFLENGT